MWDRPLPSPAFWAGRAAKAAELAARVPAAAVAAALLLAAAAAARVSRPCIGAACTALCGGLGEGGRAPGAAFSAWASGGGRLSARPRG